MAFHAGRWASARVASRPGMRWRRRAASALAALGLLLSATQGQAQITLDGSLGPSGPLSGPQFVIPSQMGQIRGNNLFHSFGQFNVRTQQSATFTGPGNIANILSRVTGGQLSTIDGLIDTRTSMPSANFFLLNPSGVMFGPGAALNVGGSFHVSSADYVRFADGAQFFAQLSQTSTLSISAPTAFGFLPGANPGPLSLEGSVLAVDAGQTLSFVGGAVSVRGATLLAPGGQVQIASAAAAAPGEMPIGNVGAGSVPQLGSVEISVGSFVDATGDPGGRIVVRAGQLLIEGATVSTGTLGDTDPVTTTGVDIWAQNGAVISGGSVVQSQAVAGGRGGDVLIASGNTPADGSVELSGGSVVISLTAGSGRGGDVILKGGSLSIADGGIATVTQSGGGVGGDVLLQGGTIAFTGGGFIQSVNSQNFSLGARGGNITLQATDSVLLSGTSQLFSLTDAGGDGGRILISGRSLTMEGGTVITSSASFADGGPGGTGGAIDIDVGRLSLTGGAVINSVNSAIAPPPPGVSFLGGDVTVNATGDVDISGVNSGIFSIAFGAPPGNIAVQAGTLRLTDGALIQAGSFAGDSEGGNVSIRASGPILLAGGAGLSSQAFNLDVGRIEVSAPSLTIDGGFINTGTLGVGQAGEIAIDVGTLSLTRGGQIASSSIFTASGGGGPITIVASGSITISGSSPVPVLPEPFRGFVESTASGIFSTAAATGAGGNVTIRAPQIQILDGGTISAASTSQSPLATAGSIGISFGDLFSMDRSTISTESLVADGGNITITSTGSVMVLTDSQITTSVRSGVGGGGNIFVGTEAQPVQFIVLNNGGIHADAFGGPGGNINIFTTALFSSTPAETAITASSALNQPGTININAVITDVSGSLADLPSAIVEAAALLRASCAARLAAGKASSFVIAGREGIPPEPGGLLPSGLASAGSGRTAAGAARFLSTELPALRLSYLDPKCGG